MSVYDHPHSRDSSSPQANENDVFYPDSEPTCAECGEYFDPDDRTWDPEIRDYICVPCAEDAGLIR